MAGLVPVFSVLVCLIGEMAKALAPLSGHAALSRFDKLCLRRNLNKARRDAAPKRLKQAWACFN